MDAPGPIRRARRLAGLAQRELARRAPTSQSQIARYESGRTSPTLDRPKDRVALPLLLELREEIEERGSRSDSGE